MNGGLNWGAGSHGGWLRGTCRQRRLPSPAGLLLMEARGDAALRSTSGFVKKNSCPIKINHQQACSFGPGQRPGPSFGPGGLFAGRRPEVWARPQPGPIVWAGRRPSFLGAGYFFLSFWLPYYQGTVPSSPQRPQRRSKGPINMPLINFEVSPKPRPAAVVAEKVEMGASWCWTNRPRLNSRGPREGATTADLHSTQWGHNASVHALHAPPHTYWHQ